MFVNPLVVSALRGGQAEAVLLALTHDGWEGVVQVPDTPSVVRVVSPWVPNGPDQQAKDACVTVYGFTPTDVPGVMNKRPLHSVQVRFVLGAEVDIVLRDVERLSHHRNFSTTHILGAKTSNVNYVMPISRKILTHDFSGDPEKAKIQINMNFRRAVYSICSFLLQCRDLQGVLAARDKIEKADAARLVRKEKHHDEYLEAKHQPSALAAERGVSGYW